MGTEISKEHQPQQPQEPNATGSGNNNNNHQTSMTNMSQQQPSYSLKQQPPPPESFSSTTSSNSSSNTAPKRMTLRGNDIENHVFSPQKLTAMTAMTAAAQGAGRSSPIVFMIEVWVFDRDSNQLHLDRDCCWVDPSLGLTNDDLEELLPPPDTVLALPPGVCLAGGMWSNTLVGGSGRSISNRQIESSASSAFLSGSIRNSITTRNDGNDDNKDDGKNVVTTAAAQTAASKRYKRLHWRNLDSLLQDPDTASTDRLQRLKEAGLDSATGVPFHVHGQSGIVVYLTSSPAASSSTTTTALMNLHKELVNNHVHDTLLEHSAAMLGTAVAMKKTQQSLEAQMREQQEQQEKEDKEKGVFAVATACCVNTERVVVKKLLTVAQKMRGASQPLAPPMTTQQACWTWLGTFLTLLVLAGINQAFVLNTEHQKLLIGPFGALMTLQYGLTAAPASQPRNAVLGQIVSGAISIVVTQIPGVPLWFHQAFGPAFSVAAMCRLGIPHPPAGAHAVLYASGDDKWSLYAIVVMSAIVCSICATVINNFSDKRQYPTYWGPFWDPSVLSIDRKMAVTVDPSAKEESKAQPAAHESSEQQQQSNNAVSIPHHQTQFQPTAGSQNQTTDEVHAQDA